MNHLVYQVLASRKARVARRIRHDHRVSEVPVMGASNIHYELAARDRGKTPDPHPRPPPPPKIKFPINNSAAGKSVDELSKGIKNGQVGATTVGRCEVRAATWYLAPAT